MLVSPDVLASRNARLPEDNDPQETAEWLDAMEAVLKFGGPERAHFLLEALIGKVARLDAQIVDVIHREAEAAAAERAEALGLDRPHVAHAGLRDLEHQRRSERAVRFHEFQELRKDGAVGERRH